MTLGVAAALVALSGASARGEQKTILAAHVELIQDPDLAMRAEEQVVQGKSAGFAWRHAARATAAALAKIIRARSSVLSKSSLVRSQ